MVDLAAVGFTADTGPLAAAGNALDQFGAKAKAAGDQVAQANAAMAGAVAPTGAIQAAADRTSVSYDTMAQRVAAAATSFGAATAASAGFSDAQQKVADALDLQLTKTQLTSAEMRVYQALTQSGLTLESAAGQAIAKKALALDQALTSTKASTVGNTELGTALKALFPAMTTTATAAGAVAVAHRGISEATTDTIESMRGLYPVVEQLGGSMGVLHGWLIASRDGFAAFAAIAGGVALLELAKIGDAAETARKNFVALTGSTALGDAAFQKVKDTAKDTGVAFDTLEGAIEAASLGLNKGEWNPPILVNASASVAKFNDGLTTLFGTLGKVLQESNATGEQESKIFAALGNDIGKTGTLTAATFSTIMQNSLPLARQIATAFGYSSLTDFYNQLQNIPIPLRQLEDQINKIKPAVDANFDPTKVNTVEQATRSLTAAWKDLLEQLAKQGAGQLVLDQFEKLKQDIGAIPGDFKAIGDALDKNKVDAQSWSDLWHKAFQVNDDDISLWGKSLDVNFTNVLALMTKAGAAIEEFFNGPETANSRVSAGFDAVGKAATSSSDLVKAFADKFGAATQASDTFAADASKDMSQVGQSATSMASNVATSLESVVSNFLSALSKMGSAAGSAVGSAVSSAGGVGGTEGLGMGAFSDPNAQGGQSAGILAPSGDAATVNLGDLGGGSGDVTDSLPAFATGGQFTVGGSGGTDTQMVSFMATPGEVVTVTVPGGSSTTSMATPSDGGAGASIPGLSTIQGQPAAATTTSIDQAATGPVKLITDAINTSTDEITKEVLAGSDKIVSAINGLASPNGVQSTSISGTSISGTGRLGTSPAFGGGATSGGGFNTKGSISPIADEQAKAYAKDAQQLQQLADQARQGGGLPFGLVGGQGQRMGANSTARKQFPLGNQIVSPPSRDQPWDYGSNGVQYGAPAGSLDDFGGYGAPPWIQSPDYGTYGSSSYDSSGGFTPSNPDLGYMPGGTSGFPDSTATTGLDSLDSSNLSGGSASLPDYSDVSNYLTDLGSFAGGGSFIAGRSAGPSSMDAGTDTIHGIIHLTPGEEVRVTPQGSQQAVSDMPAPSPSRDISGGAGNSGRPVSVTQNFYGQAANMASSMSRAQAARMIGRALQ